MRHFYLDQTSRALEEANNLYRNNFARLKLKATERVINYITDPHFTHFKVKEKRKF